MSVYGDGSFRQDLLDWIRSTQSSHGKTSLQTVEALAEILRWYAEQAIYEENDKDG